MAGEASLDFRLRKFDETRNYLLDVINHNDLMSEKYKEICKYLYIKYQEKEKEAWYNSLVRKNKVRYNENSNF